MPKQIKVYALEDSLGVCFDFQSFKHYRVVRLYLSFGVVRL